MRYFGQDELHILAECNNCGKVLKMKRENLTSAGEGFTVNSDIKCKCGSLCTSIEGKPDNPFIDVRDTCNDLAMGKQHYYCPKCGSNNMSIVPKKPKEKSYNWEILLVLSLLGVTISPFIFALLIIVSIIGGIGKIIDKNNYKKYLLMECNHCTKEFNIPRP